MLPVAIASSITTAAAPPSGPSVNVTPNATSLPGVKELESLVGGLETFALVACLAGFMLAALVWAIAAHAHNSRFAAGGKIGVITALVAALLVGGGGELINFFSSAGSKL